MCPVLALRSPPPPPKVCAQVNLILGIWGLSPRLCVEVCVALRESLLLSEPQFAK
jgi:hypothetical protein